MDIMASPSRSKIKGLVSDDPIHQILKAKNSYWKEAGVEILELVVVLIRGDRQTGHQLEENCYGSWRRLTGRNWDA
jgi:hypothetical protein